VIDITLRVRVLWFGIGFRVGDRVTVLGLRLRVRDLSVAVAMLRLFRRFTSRMVFIAVSENSRALRLAKLECVRFPFHSHFPAPLPLFTSHYHLSFSFLTSPFSSLSYPLPSTSRAK